MLLNEEFAQRVYRITCRAHNENYLEQGHIENAASKSLLVVSILVFLLTLVLLIVNNAIHCCVDLRDALREHLEASFSDCLFIFILLSFLVEVAIFSMTINQVCLAVKEAALLLLTNSSIYIKISPS